MFFKEVFYLVDLTSVPLFFHLHIITAENNKNVSFKISFIIKMKEVGHLDEGDLLFYLDNYNSSYHLIIYLLFIIQYKYVPQKVRKGIGSHGWHSYSNSLNVTIILIVCLWVATQQRELFHASQFIYGQLLLRWKVKD